MRGLTRDGTAEPISRDQILTLEQGKEKMCFPCSVDQKHQNCHPYPEVDGYSALRGNHTVTVIAEAEMKNSKDLCVIQVVSM